jgi:hypothetical protein
MNLRPVSFVRSPDIELDELAAELRRSPRARVIARGLPVMEALDAFFMEQSGRTGGR